MKPLLPLQISSSLGLLVGSLVAAPAQGLPPRPAAIDPTTGLPLAPPKPWKDADWKDPDIIMANFSYDGVPLEVVAEDLRKQFKNGFDLVIPTTWYDPFGQATPLDVKQQTIRLQLRNVSASEVFNAMNLLFETENDPLRWELRMNGKRPAAVLRVLPELLPRTRPSMIDPNTGLPVQPPETRRMVWFVGDLVGDHKPGGMTMEQLVKTIAEVWEMTYGQKGVVQFHNQAQLIIVSGTPDQIDFIQQTVRELRVRAQLERGSEPKPAQLNPPELKPRLEPRPVSPAGQK